jgi:hypothetical protein
MQRLYFNILLILFYFIHYQYFVVTLINEIIIKNLYKTIIKIGLYNIFKDICTKLKWI